MKVKGLTAPQTKILESTEIVSNEVKTLRALLKECCLHFDLTYSAKKNLVSGQFAIFYEDTYRDHPEIVIKFFKKPLTRFSITNNFNDAVLEVGYKEKKHGKIVRNQYGGSTINKTKENLKIADPALQDKIIEFLRKVREGPDE